MIELTSIEIKRVACKEAPGYTIEKMYARDVLVNESHIVYADYDFTQGFDKHGDPDPDFEGKEYSVLHMDTGEKILVKETIAEIQEMLKNKNL